MPWYQYEHDSPPFYIASWDEAEFLMTDEGARAFTCKPPDAVLKKLSEPYHPKPYKEFHVSDKQFLKTPEFRGSYANLVTARLRKNAKPGEKPKFGIVIVLEKAKPSTKAFMQELKKAAEAAAKAKGIDIAKKWKKPWKDGDAKDEDEEEGSFPGCWVVRANSTFRPHIIDVHGDELQTEDDLYSGAWYKVKISLFAWIHDEGGKGVSASLETGIKTKDDERFGGGGDAKADFAEDVGGSSEGGDDDLLG